MDVEAVHTTAPHAGIVVLYDTSDLMDSVDYAAFNHIANLVSNSWGYICSTGSCADSQLPFSLLLSTDTRLVMDASLGMTILFSSGDQGATPDEISLGTEFPASDPNVLAVGGTNLALTGCSGTTCGGYGSETAATISGGGYSAAFAEPPWQVSSIGPTPNGGRGVPDVSMIGYAPGFWVYSTASNECDTSPVTVAGWFGCAGTSLSSPLWAGILADALQYRGGGFFGNVDPLLYQLGSSAQYSSLFHDVTSGNNNLYGRGGYSAAVGWDPVTGWGSPVANALAAALTPTITATAASANEYATGSTIYYAASGFTADGPVSACISTDHVGSTLLCQAEPLADNLGNAAGSMVVGVNVPLGIQMFYLYDKTTAKYSSPVQLTILSQPATTTSTTATNTQSTTTTVVLTSTSTATVTDTTFTTSVATVSSTSTFATSTTSTHTTTLTTTVTRSATTASTSTARTTLTTTFRLTTTSTSTIAASTTIQTTTSTSTVRTTITVTTTVTTSSASTKSSSSTSSTRWWSLTRTITSTCRVNC